MWLITEYSPTNLFSLRRSDATLPAAKSLLCPSPYAIKMALLDVIITYSSINEATDNFDLIKNMDIRIKLPENICVNNCFVKIWKYDKSHPKPDGNSWKSTVAFREYVFFNGNIFVAVNYNKEEEKDFLINFFSKINYFGKRGGFFQFINYESNIFELDSNFSIDIHSKNLNLDDLKSGIILPMDDFENNVTFDMVSNYSKEKTKRKKRFFNLPIKITKANKNFTLYKKLT